jgi:hypothetical protein
MMRRVFLTILLAAMAGPIAEGAQQQSFDPRDFSGYWHRKSRLVTFSNVPTGPTDTRNPEAPFTAEGKKRFDANKPGYGPRVTMQRNDPIGRCEPMGLIRNLNAEITEPHPTFRIVQTPGRIIQFFEYRHDWREIWMEGQKLPKWDEVDPKWNGYSVGRMEGDTLVLETTGLDERAWLDKWGYPLSEQIHVEERYRRLDAETLELTITITDPLLYTGPWKSDTKLYQLDPEKAKRWDEQIYCVPSEEFPLQKLIGSGNVLPE